MHKQVEQTWRHLQFFFQCFCFSISYFILSSTRKVWLQAQREIIFVLICFFTQCCIARSQLQQTLIKGVIIEYILGTKFVYAFKMPLVSLDCLLEKQITSNQCHIYLFKICISIKIHHLSIYCCLFYSRMHDMLRRVGKFAVHILAQDQVKLHFSFIINTKI